MATQKVHIALADTTGNISRSELERITAALQVQVTRDFAPVWGQDATLHVFDSVAEMPVGFWPLTIVEKVDVEGVNGYHWVDEYGLPYAKVEYRQEYWPLTASHELLEMLANPFVERKMLVKGIDDTGQEVELLVEVSDPVENKDFGYRIDGVLVSDFYYPAFFDLTKRDGVKYDHLGWLKEPRKLLNGGYISWQNAAGEWWQGFMVEGKLIIKKLGDQTPLTTAETKTIWGLVAGLVGFGLLITFIVKLIKRNGSQRR